MKHLVGFDINANKGYVMVDGIIAGLSTDNTVSFIHMSDRFVNKPEDIDVETIHYTKFGKITHQVEQKLVACTTDNLIIGICYNPGDRYIWVYDRNDSTSIQYRALKSEITCNAITVVDVNKYCMVMYDKDAAADIVFFCYRNFNEKIKPISVTEYYNNDLYMETYPQLLDYEYNFHTSVCDFNEQGNDAISITVNRGEGKGKFQATLLPFTLTLDMVGLGMPRE